MKLDRRFLNVSFVVQSVANSPPDNPTAGTQYIVGANPTGAFAGAVANSIAYYDGSSWVFTTPEAGELEVLCVQTRELLSWNGIEWAVTIAIDNNSNIAPVLAVVPSGTSLPATASEDDVFLKTDEAKLYTATGTDTWNSGTVVVNGGRYASSTDHKIYTSDGSTLTPENVAEGGFFLSKEDNRLYIYDGSRFVRVGGSGATYAIDIHSITAAEITAKSFSLTRSIAAGQENNTSLSVAGLELAVGVDFVASGSTISWNGKGLDNAGLDVGDVIIVHYVTSAEDSGAQEEFSFAYLVHDVRALQDEVANLSSDSDAQSSEIGALAFDVRALRDEDNDYSSEISVLASDVRMLRDEVEDNDPSGEISALKSDVRMLRDEVEDNDPSDEVSTLKSDVRALQDEVAGNDHSSEISTLASDVRALQDEDNNLSDEVSALKSNVRALQDEVAGNDHSDEISTLKSNMSVLQDEVTGNGYSDEISALKSNVRALRDEVAGNDHSNEINVLASDVRTLQDEDDDHGNEISALKEAVYQLRQEVDTLLSQSPTVNITYQFISESATGV